MADPRPARPGLAGLADRLAGFEGRLHDMEAPSGSQRGGSSDRLITVAERLASPRKFEAKTAGFTTPTVPADGVARWYATSPDTQIANLDVPSGRLLVTASCVEAALTPGAGGLSTAFLSFAVADQMGSTVPLAGLGQNSGRLTLSSRGGFAISSGPVLVTIDQTQFVGPFKIRLFPGLSVSAGSSSGGSCVFSLIMLGAEIIR